MTAVAEARAVFNVYAGVDGEIVPSMLKGHLGDVPDLQVKLARWQQRNFGGASDEQIALGVAEEAGELCHAVLKRSQRIRGMDDREAFREAAGDAVADVVIYAM